MVLFLHCATLKGNVDLQNAKQRDVVVVFETAKLFETLAKIKFQLFSLIKVLAATFAHFHVLPTKLKPNRKKRRKTTTATLNETKAIYPHQNSKPQH